MNQDPLKTLAQELKEAAQKYTQATGKRFDAEFDFVSMDFIGFDRPTYQVSEVLVRESKEIRA